MHFPLPPDQLKKLLVDEGLITAERFDAILADAERKSQNLVDVLVAERIADVGYLNDVIAKALGVSRIDLSESMINKDVMKLLPEATAREHQVILFGMEEDGAYDAAMIDPSDLETIEFLSQRLKARIKPFLATAGDLNQGYSVYGRELEQDFKKIIEENIRASLANPSKDAKEAAAQLPIVGIVDNILSYGLSSRASDIHIEILEESLFIRYRIDGILYEIMDVTKNIHPAIVARIKLLAGLKIDEHLMPQDGRFRYRVGSETIDVRVSVIPTFYGEKVEMRLLEAAQKPLSLEEVGMLPEAVKVVTANLKKAYGMIISCANRFGKDDDPLCAHEYPEPAAGERHHDRGSHRIQHAVREPDSDQRPGRYHVRVRPPALLRQDPTSSWSAKSATRKRRTSPCRRL